jgi:thiamine biosynthesis lipoprotein ApbE
MNTSLDIILWGIDRETACLVSEKIFKSIREVQSVLDRFNPAAEVCRVNKNAFSEETVVSPYLIEAIKRGVNDFNRTQGYFNIFAGDAYSSFKKGSGEYLNFVDPTLLPEDLIEIDENNNSIRFLQRSVSLDFGGVGKGLALDKASIILDDFGVQNAFISFGGSSILTKGHHPHGEYWPFSFKETEIEDQVWALNDDAVSVSSTHQGKGNIAHIFDLKSGCALNSKIAAVQGVSAAGTEVLSTALIASPPEKHHEIVQNFNVKKWTVYNIHLSK